jgi:adenylate cyclase
MFSDVSGFARAFTEDEVKVVKFIQRYYEAAGEQIVHHGGSILKYIGDSVLSVFPSGAEAKAVDCALETQRNVDSLISEMDLSPEMGLGVGIAAGEVHVGFFGHPSLRREDLFGQVVNEAAIITSQDGVSVTGPIYERVKDRFLCVRAPDVHLKWSDIPLQVWKIEASS